MNFAENYIDLSCPVNFVENSVGTVHGKGGDGVCLGVVDGKVLDEVGISFVMSFLSEP